MAVIKKFHERIKNKRLPWRANAVVAKRRDSDTGDPPVVSREWLTTLRVIATLVIGMILSFALPERLTEQFATRQVAKLAAPITGIEYNTSHRDDITVLIIDRESLAEVGESWPAPYGYYARILRHIAHYHPKAVFIDLILSHKGDEATLGDLKNAINELSNPDKYLSPKGQCCPVHVFLGASLEGKQLHISPALDELDGATKVSLEYYPDEVDRIAWKYPMTYGAAAPSGRPGEPTQIRSAALAIYEDSFDGIADEMRNKPLPEMALTWGFDSNGQGLLWTYKPHEEELSRASESIQESVKPAPYMVAVALHRKSPAVEQGQAKEPAKEAENESSSEGGSGAELYCDTSESRLERFWKAELHAWLPPSGRPLCVFHRTIHARTIGSMSAADEQKAFTDRVVMIGTSIKYSNDIVDSPLHDRIPGVFLHAMALDNLLESAGDYKRATEPSFSFADGNWRVILLAMFGLAGVGLVRAAKDWWEHRKHTRHIRHPHHLPRQRHRDRIRSVSRTAILLMRGQSADALVVTSGADEKPDERHKERHGARHEERLSGRPPRYSENWWAMKLGYAILYIARKVGGLAVLVITVAILLYIGQRVLNVGYLTAVHLVACAVAAEWFEWGKKLVNWLYDIEETTP